MIRLILVSFGFLAWAFYEMSGGAAFDPINTRMSRVEAQNDTTYASDSAGSAQTSRAFAAADQDSDPLQSDTVTRVSLNLTTLQEALDQSGDSANVPSIAKTPEPQQVPANAGITTSSLDTPAIIPSLIITDGPDSTVENAALDTDPVLDIRIVSGNRVNVRGGPSTGFPVVSTLVQGDSVEVLEDNSDGWVKMRALVTGEEGWMADFLLTNY